MQDKDLHLPWQPWQETWRVQRTSQAHSVCRTCIWPVRARCAEAGLKPFFTKGLRSFYCSALVRNGVLSMQGSIGSNRIMAAPLIPSRSSRGSASIEVIDRRYLSRAEFVFAMPGEVLTVRPEAIVRGKRNAQAVKVL